VYHVFYLSYPKPGENTPIAWAHISSRDLLHWTEHPKAIEGCLTGSIIEKDGVFHAFTTEDGRIGHATSRDLDTWTKDPQFLLSIDPRWYEASWRDPCVIWNPNDKQYWMVACSRVQGDNNNALKGCVALLTSPDLVKWTIQPPLWSPQFSTWLECPDLFPYGDKWVLLYYWRQTRVRLADNLNGPWLRPAIESPDGWNSLAAKTMGDGKRRIQIGMIPRRPCYCQAPEGSCTLLLPREWRLTADGVPATCPASEVLAAFTEGPTHQEGARVFKPVMSPWKIDGDTAAASPAIDHSAMALWCDAPANFYLRTEVRFTQGSQATIFIRGQGGIVAYGYETPLDTGYRIDFDPNNSRIALRRLYEWDQRGLIQEIVYPFSKDQPTTVEIFLDGDILEVFLDHRCSLVGRLPENPKGSLALLAQDGPVTFERIQIKTLP
jgi:beta-fructofuranosidase